jgi:DNA-binding response OmpR family regulator
MQPTGLEDRAILIVEDEPVIAMDVAQAFERAGAATAVTSTLHHALVLVEDENLSAAVLDHVLSDGDSSPLCRRMKERGLPFVVYSGLGKLDGPCAFGAQVAKPEKPAVLVSMVAKLLQGEAPHACG